MREGATTAYAGLAMLVGLGVIVQVFLAGLGIFGAASFELHEAVGVTLHGVTVLLVLAAALGPRTRADIGLAVGLVLLATLQVGLVEARDDAPAVAAFHPVLALAILGLVAYMAWRVTGTRRRRPAA